MMSAFKIRSIYLLMYMAFAVWRVFYNIYLEDLGFNGSQIGTLNAIVQSTIFIAVTLWGSYADKRGIRPTLKIAVIASAVAMFGLTYVNDFWLLLFYLPFLTFFYHPLGSLTDALAVQFADTDKKYSYGGFRLWGSLGWAIASIAGGYLFMLIPIKYIFPISGGLFLILIPFLSTRKKVRTYTPNFESLTLKQVFNNKPLVLFIGVIALYGIVCAPVFSYLNLYFKEINGDNSTVGLAYAIMAFSELPFFIIGNQLLKKLGARKLILLAIVSMVIRYLVYGLFPDVNVALATGLLQGVSLAFFLVGAVEFLKKLVPEDQHATAQSILWGGYIGLGQTVGALSIGFLIDHTGMVGVMRIAVGLAILCLLLTVYYFRTYKQS